MRRNAVLILSLFLLGSCSGSWVVTAKYVANALTFEVEKKDWTWPTPCISSGWEEGFAVIDDGKKVWEILPIDKRPCPDSGDFPLTYGVQPAGFVTKVQAEPLVPGRTYEIKGIGPGGLFHGRFTPIRRTVFDAINIPVR